MGKSQKYLTEAFWVGFGMGMSAIALVLGTRVLTTLLPVEEYGRLALAISLTTMVVQFFGNPIAQTAVRFFITYKKSNKLPMLLDGLGRYLFRQMALVIIVSIVLLSFSFLVPAKLPKPQFIITIGGMSLFLLLNRVALGFEDAARERSFRGIMQGTFETSRFIIAISIIILLNSYKAETALYCFLISAAIFLIFHSIFLKKKLKISLKKMIFSRNDLESSDMIFLKKFQKPLYISNICIWLVMMSERWALKANASLLEVGGYSAVYQLSFMPMVLFSTFIILFTEPILYPFMGVDGKSVQSRSYLDLNFCLAIVIIIVTIFISIVLFFSHGKVATLLLGNDYREYSWLFPWLVLAGGFFAAAQQFLLELQAKLQTKIHASLWVVIAIVACGGYFLSTKYFSLNGIVVSFVSVNFLLMLSSVSLLKFPKLLKRF